MKSKSQDRTRTRPGASDFVAFIHDWGRPEWVLLAVEAPIEKVTTAYARLHQSPEPARQVSVHPATKKDNEIAPLVAVVQPANGSWCLILRQLCLPLDLQLIMESTEDARELSSSLRTRALTFYGADTSFSMAFSLFGNGKQIESKEWDQTQTRPVDKAFDGLGLCVPACYPSSGRGGAGLAVAGSSASAILRADLIKLDDSVREKQAAALLRAVLRGELPKVRLLLRKGAKPTSNVIHKSVKRAVWTGDFSILKQVLKNSRAGPPQFSPSAVSSAFVADNKPLDRRIKVAKLLLDAGADINGDGGEALRTGIQQENVELIKFLLGAGADVNASKSHGSTPLHYAAFLGQVECAKLLLQAGAKLDALNSDGKTPVQWAAFHGNKEMVKLLTAGSAT